MVGPVKKTIGFGIWFKSRFEKLGFEYVNCVSVKAKNSEYSEMFIQQ